MSIASEISRLSTLRNNIRTKLIALGIISDSSADLEDCYDGINAVTAQSAATYHPSSSDQTIASGKYLSGTQTIKAVTTTNLTAANIANGVTVKVGDSTDDDCVTSVTGTMQGGGNLTTKTVAASDNIQIITKDDEIRKIDDIVTADSHSVSEVCSRRVSLSPYEDLVVNTTYMIVGKIYVGINLYSGALHQAVIYESYTVNTEFKFSTTPVTIVENNDANAYISKITIEKYTSGSTRCTLKFTCQKAETYGFYLDLSIREINNYDGLSSVTIDALKYTSTLIKNIVMRSNTDAWTRFEWPNGITYIGKYAFAEWACTFTSLPDTVTEIKDYAFYDCTVLPLTSLPSGITKIGPYAFYSCFKIALSSLPSGLTKIENSAFYFCRNMTLSSLPSGITSIESTGFYNCYGITVSSAPDGVTQIGGSAFSGCKKITSFTCNGALTTLGSGAFNAGTSTGTYPMEITTASFPNMTTSSLSTAFGNTTAARAAQALEFIDIGSTKAIAANAFANCYSLETLVLRRSDAICSLANVSAFLNTPLRGYDSKTATVYVPQSLISTYQSASNWSTLYTGGTVTFSAIEGSDYELD